MINQPTNNNTNNEVEKPVEKTSPVEKKDAGYGNEFNNFVKLFKKKAVSNIFN